MGPFVGLTNSKFTVTLCPVVHVVPGLRVTKGLPAGTAQLVVPSGLNRVAFELNPSKEIAKGPASGAPLLFVMVALCRNLPVALLKRNPVNATVNCDVTFTAQAD